MNSGRKLAVLLLGCLLASTGIAQQPPTAQVMLFGVFHFSNPGRDVVKTKHINVLTSDNQAYLEELSARIAGFEPTVVLLEFNPEREGEMQARYEEYLDGELELPVNEIYQLGFRIARLAGVDSIHSFDEREVGWEAEALFEYMPEKAPQIKESFDNLIEEITTDSQNAHDTLSLADLLRRSNDPELDRINKSIYLLTNPVGADDSFVGADSAASWWHRNFRMYARIQKHARSGERVLVIGGQGHIAILRDLLDDDMDRESVDVLPYL